MEACQVTRIRFLSHAHSTTGSHTHSTPFTCSHAQLDYSHSFLFMPKAGGIDGILPNLDRRIKMPRALDHCLLHNSSSLRARTIFGGPLLQPLSVHALLVPRPADLYMSTCKRSVLQTLELRVASFPKTSGALLSQC